VAALGDNLGDLCRETGSNRSMAPNEEGEPGLCLGGDINPLWDAVSRAFADFDGDSVLTSDTVKVLTKIKKAPEKRSRMKSRKGKEIRKSGILDLSVAARTKAISRQKFMANLPVDCGFDVEDQVAMFMGYVRHIYIKTR